MSAIDGWGLTLMSDGEYHVHPLGDRREHNLDVLECWCRPTRNEDGLIEHNSADRRETYEEATA